MLKKVVDLEDELNMLLQLLHEQKKVIESFKTGLIRCLNDPYGGIRPEDEEGFPWRALMISEGALQRVSEYHDDIQKKKEEARHTRETVGTITVFFH